MSRIVAAWLAVALSLPAAATFAASAPAKRHIYHWHGYGFLPGYQQPPNNSVPTYLARRSSRRFAERPGASFPAYSTPYYWYGGGWYYFGHPGFFRGRYNGGSFGPCWTQTPIGPMWNCG